MSDICKILIPKMSDAAINAVNNNGDTALTCAGRKGLDEVCNLLIPRMSDEAINTVSKKGNTALTFAACTGLDEVCKLLIHRMSAEAINAVNNNGDTALTFAVRKGYTVIIPILEKAQIYYANLISVQKLVDDICINENFILYTLNGEIDGSVRLIAHSVIQDIRLQNEFYLRFENNLKAHGISQKTKGLIRQINSELPYELVDKINNLLQKGNDLLFGLETDLMYYLIEDMSPTPLLLLVKSKYEHNMNTSFNNTKAGEVYYGKYKELYPEAEVSSLIDKFQAHTITKNLSTNMD